MNQGPADLTVSEDHKHRDELHFPLQSNPEQAEPLRRSKQKQKSKKTLSFTFH